MNATQFVMAYAIMILTLSTVYAQQQGESAITQLYSVTQLCSGNVDGRYSPPTHYQGLPGKMGPKGIKGDSSTFVENEEKNRRFSNKLASLHIQLTSVQNDNQRLKADLNETKEMSNSRIQTLEKKIDKTEAALNASNDKLTGVEESLKNILSINRWKLCSTLKLPSTIEDNQITASSYWNNAAKYAPRHGRLFGTSGVGSWCAAVNRANEWIEVDLEDDRKVVGVATQGRNAADQWVTSYTILFKSNTDNSFQNVDNESGEAVVFQGNNDENTPVTNEFRQPIIARYFRVNVLTWFHHISLRFDLFMC